MHAELHRLYVWFHMVRCMGCGCALQSAVCGSTWHAVWRHGFSLQLALVTVVHIHRRGSFCDYMNSGLRNMRIAMKLSKIALLLGILAIAVAMRADDSRFDLPGPKIDVYVTRGGVTLPISQVPSLLPRDTLRVKADLPATQSNHLLLIVAFLRSTTNEPPDNWFTKVETWRQPIEGTTVAVPDGAQKAIMFVAPETGGDFDTLRSAVKKNPGLFTRATVSLRKASLKEQRIQRYLAGMRAVSSDDGKMIESRSAKLAATLALAPNADCFKKPVDDQVDCLTQTSDDLLLDDSHGQTMANAISTGASSDLANEAAQADGALYSTYVGTLVDLVHLAGLLHTAQYRYIPAISFPNGATMNLKLNSPPSFYNPKSVIVIALPPIEPVHPPQLHLEDPQATFCLANPSMALPFRGTPSLFSTGFPHDLAIVFGSGDSAVRIALTPDAFDGGLIPSNPIREGLLDRFEAIGSDKGMTLQGKVEGFWGFEKLDGPTLTFQYSPDDGLKLLTSTALFAGQDNQATLRGRGTACVNRIKMSSQEGESSAVTFDRGSGNDNLLLNLPLKNKPAGTYSIAVEQYGSAKVMRTGLAVYSKDIRVDKLLLGAGDSAILMGEHLEKVASVKVGDHTFVPTGAAPDERGLQLRAQHAPDTNDARSATVTLEDGGVMTVPVATQDSGATLKVLSIDSTLATPKGELPVTLNSQSDIALHGILHFVIQSASVFPRGQILELSTADGAVHGSISLASGGLILEDERTAVATVDLDKTFGESAFGELRMRAIPGDGTVGNWVTLGKLVRRPHITAEHCTNVGVPTCMIEGSDLFLALAFSATEDFASAVPVPTSFDGSNFAIPMKPNTRSSTLYVRLRDDPNGFATIRIPTRGSHP